MQNMSRSTSRADSEILRAVARKGRNYLNLDEDRAWLKEIVSDPPLQLARMKQRGSLAPVAKGRYVVLPYGSSNARQAAPLGLLLAAAFSGREDYFLGYLSAIVDHHLADEPGKTIFIGVFSPDAPKIKQLGGRRVQMTRILSEKKRMGIERVRASGRAFYRRSDLERTLLDTLDRPKLCGDPEIWVRAWSRAFMESRVDVPKLVDYAEQWGGSVAARCAFWLRDLGQPREARLLMQSIGGPLTGRRLLDASKSFGEGDWQRDRETGLVVNIPDRVIGGWLAYEK